MLSPATYMLENGKLARTFPHTMFYAPFLQHQIPNSLQALQLRTAGAPETMIPEVEHIVEAIEKR